MSILPNVINDGREDVSMNALPQGRDYLSSARAIREVEAAAGFDNPRAFTCSTWTTGSLLE